MFGRHLTKGFSWVLVVALLLTSVTVAAAQQGDETPVKPPAPPVELIPETPDVEPLLPSGDAVGNATDAARETVPLWNVAGNFTIRDFLGVGTEAPAYKIHASMSSNGSTSVRVDNTNAGTQALSRLILATAEDRTLQLQKFGNGFSGTWNSLALANWARIRTDPLVNGVVITTGGSKPLVFGTGDIERGRFTPAGNLLVGTRSDDSHRVTVRNTGSDNVLRVIGPDGGGLGYGARLNFGDSDYVYLDEDLDDKLTIYASSRTALMGGPVGVGTLTPTAGKLHVQTTTGTAVYGSATSTSGTNYGVYGQVNNAGSIGVAGFQPGYGYGDLSWYVPGAFFGGRNGTVAVSKDGNGVGVVGQALASSGTRVGVFGDVMGTGYGLYTLDNIYVGGNCVGCTMVYIAHNASQDTLTVGDLVAVRGVGKTLQGQTTPVLEVGRAAVEDSSVLGVVYMRGQLYATGPGSTAAEETVQPVEGDAAPGDYLLVVTNGLAQVRIGQGAGLAPGVALTVADISGTAKVAEGTAAVMFGRAMEAQPNEKGLIWAMIGTK